MQKQNVGQPYFAVWLMIPVILLISWFRKTASLDIQLSDTYFVVTEPFLGGFFAVFLLLNGLVYWLMRERKLIPSVSWIQVAGSILAILFLVIFAASTQQANVSGTFLSPAEFRRDQEHNTQVVFALLIWIVCQLLLFLHVTFTLILSSLKK